MSIACLHSTAPRTSPENTRRPARAWGRARAFMREIWIGPVIALGSVLCGGFFTLLAHVLANGAP